MKMFEVGGCVRDRILGIHSKDIDFSVEAESFSAMREELTELGFEIFVENPEFLTIRARFPKTEQFAFRKGLTADFVLCRKEGAYSDGRHPDEVEVGTLFDDLARRDFTMNAIALDPETGAFIDPHDGIRDIKHQLICCVGTPEERFREDALRAIRAMRFSVTKDFAIHPSIMKVFDSDWLPPLLSSVSKERKRDELMKMFHHDTIESLWLIESLTLPMKDAIFCDGLWLEPTLRK